MSFIRFSNTIMIQSLDNAQKTVKHAYKIPICAEEDYNLFITNLEKLITEGLKTEPNKSLKLIYNFIMIIIPKLS